MKTLRPFFPFYGGKWRAAGLYPDPLFPLIVEPFAGSAGYSVRNHRHDVTLYEADPVIAGVWDYLINVSPQEINSLPNHVDHVDEIRGPQESRWFVGFWLNTGSSRPRKTPGQWMRNTLNGTSGSWRKNSYWGPGVKRRISSQVDEIRHWNIINVPYHCATNPLATWFVDPPYCGPTGKEYVKNIINYDHLSGWCRDRPGQLIVCERSGATWLPFEYLGKFRGTTGKFRTGTSEEAVFILNQCPDPGIDGAMPDAPKQDRTTGGPLSPDPSPELQGTLWLE